MDFKVSKEQQKLCQEIVKFAKKELPAGWFGPYDFEGEYDEGCWPITQKVAIKLGERGWLGMSWPKEYGGQGRSLLDDFLCQEEIAHQGIPGASMGISGTGWVGHSLLGFGTEEQKKKFIPPIAAGREFWCTGYSEPGAGSDLAALQCRAVHKGNDYVVSGQKVWTSAAHISDWCWLAVRTDPDNPKKHVGISLLIVDMKSKGITVNPLVDMVGLHSLNEVFFDEVVVPRDNLVGEENRGWYHIMSALAYERTWCGISVAGATRRMLEDLVGCAAEMKNTMPGFLNEPSIRHQLSEIAIEVEVARLLAHQLAWRMDRGMECTYEAPMSKLYSTEVLQRIVNVGSKIFGPYGQLGHGSKGQILHGELSQSYLGSPSAGIYAGSSEVERDLIATMGLGLPRR